MGSGMARAKRSRTRRWLIGGFAILASVVAVKTLTKVLVEDGQTDDESGPQKLVLHINERRYPPFFDDELRGIQVEGEFDETGAQQLVIIGISQKEFDAGMSKHDHAFALARRDSAGLWHTVVAEKALLYGTATDVRGEVYAVSIYIGPGSLDIIPGVMQANHFVPYKTARALATTNAEGLIYDYPGVPIVSVANAPTHHD